jgi:hypothetical protein
VYSISVDPSGMWLASGKLYKPLELDRHTPPFNKYQFPILFVLLLLFLRGSFLFENHPIAECLKAWKAHQNILVWMRQNLYLIATL